MVPLILYGPAISSSWGLQIFWYSLPFISLSQYYLFILMMYWAVVRAPWVWCWLLTHWQLW